VSTFEHLEAARRRAPAIAGAVVGVIADNPAQCALVVSGAYVVTRGLGRLVRPSTVAGAVMTACVSQAVCWWLVGEAQRRGVLVFRVRDPATGALVTLAELAELAAASGGCCADPPG